MINSFKKKERKSQNNIILIYNFCKICKSSKKSSLMNFFVKEYTKKTIGFR